MYTTAPSSAIIISFNNSQPADPPKAESFVQATEAWLDRWHEDPRLSQSNKNLCTRVYRHFNRARFERTGELLAWPGWATLMSQAGLSKMSIFRGLRKLEKLGGLKILHGGRDAKTGWKLPNQYLAIIPLSPGNRVIPGQVTFDTKTRYQDVTRLVEERLVEKEYSEPSAPPSAPPSAVESISEKEGKKGNSRGATPPEKSGSKEGKPGSNQAAASDSKTAVLKNPLPPFPRDPLSPFGMVSPTSCGASIVAEGTDRGRSHA
jgi:hypothetical protein